VFTLGKLSYCRKIGRLKVLMFTILQVVENKQQLRQHQQ